VDVIRVGLDLLEEQVARVRQVERWKHAATLVAESSDEVNRDFQANSRLKGID
jgi:hypothetical protein